MNFRVLTIDTKESKLLKEKGKSTRSITVNGVRYSQVGKNYAFQTKNKWFLNNFKSAGAKVISSSEGRGEKREAGGTKQYLM